VQKIDIAKALFIFVSSLVGSGLIFGYGLYAGGQKDGVYRFFAGLVSNISEAVTATTEDAGNITGIKPTNFLQPARFDGEGVTINNAPDQDSLILISSFYDGKNEIRLIERDGSIVNRWPLEYSKIFPRESRDDRPNADLYVDTHGALLEPDGSIAFNFEYRAAVKLDWCGNVQWRVRRAHHSIEKAEGGGYWVPGNRRTKAGDPVTLRPFQPPYSSHTIMRLSEDGEVLQEISVPKLLQDNGLEPILTASGEMFVHGKKWDQQIVHMNKIEELSSELADDFPSFQAGDLALSLRKLNLVVVLDPVTEKVKWHSVGPWVRQHDVEFRRGGTLMVFNNNGYRTDYLPGAGRSHPSIVRKTNILEIDPITREHNIVFGDKPGQEMMSVIRGKVEPTQSNGIIITEFEAGRIIEADAAGNIIWEYINRYSDTDVVEITEARVYPADYLDLANRACETNNP